MLVFATATASASASANELTDNLTTTAKIENFCSISANDLNFGVVNLPLTAQSANSTMNVLCNNNTSYTIDLAYGGIYGQGATGNGNIYTSYPSAGGETTDFKIFLIYENGVNIGALSCGKSTGGLKNTVYFFANQPVASLYGAKTTGSYIPDVYSACNNGYINSQTLTNLAGVPAYSYGVMNGAAKSDKLAYSISLPNDSSKVWNAGNHSYTSKGIGSNQEIAINASLIPDKSSSKYIAQDTYLDTITATISY